VGSNELIELRDRAVTEIERVATTSMLSTPGTLRGNLAVAEYNALFSASAIELKNETTENGIRIERLPGDNP
jgi:hypothetical protein